MPLTLSKPRFLKKTSEKITFPEKVSATKMRMLTGSEWLVETVSLAQHLVVTLVVGLHNTNRCYSPFSKYSRNLLNLLHIEKWTNVSLEYKIRMDTQCPSSQKSIWLLKNPRGIRTGIKALKWLVPVQVLGSIDIPSKGRYIAFKIVTVQSFCKLG